MRNSRSECGFLKLVSQNALCVLEREAHSHWTANVVGLQLFPRKRTGLFLQGARCGPKTRILIEPRSNPTDFMCCKYLFMEKPYVFKSTIYKDSYLKCKSQSALIMFIKLLFFKTLNQPTQLSVIGPSWLALRKVTAIRWRAFALISVLIHLNDSKII